MAQLRTREAILLGAGISVACASTAAEAFTHLRPKAAKVDVIVTDHVMPGVDGSVFVQQIRQLRPQTPVIVISGLVEAEEQYANIPVTFLRKPCKPESLIRAVQARKPTRL